MGLIDRAKNIIMRPRQEWPVIDAEPTTVGALYTGYIIPLSLLPIIASTVGMALFGISVPFVGTIRQPLGLALGGAAVGFVLGLIAIYVMGLIIDALAPSFSGTKNNIQALKVAGYSYTAYWVFGILTIVPGLRLIAGLLGLYSIYLLYTGLPVLMKSPPEKAFGYTAVTIIVGIILWICIGVVIGMLGFGLAATGVPHTTM